MATTWNPADKAPSISLTNGNLTASILASESTADGVRATDAKSSGKWYWEIDTSDSTSPQNFLGHGIGVCDVSYDLTNSALGVQFGNAWAFGEIYFPTSDRKWHNGVGEPAGGTDWDKQLISIAVDFDLDKIWWAVDGVWRGDPAAGTGAAYSNLTGYPLFPAITMDTGAGTQVGAANFGGSAFTYAVPSGFLAYSPACSFTEIDITSRIRVLLKDEQGLLWTDTQVANELKIAVEDLSSRGLCVETVSDITTSSGTVDYAAPTDATSIVACVHYDRHKSPVITWNPNDKHGTVYLASSNLLAGRFTASEPQWGSVRENQGVSSGKVYAEFTYTTITRGAASYVTLVGVMHDTADLATFIGDSPSNGWGYRDDGVYKENGSSSSAPPGFVQGDIIMIALDMDDGKIWWGKNGTWNNSGDPETGANAAYSNLSGTVYCAFSGRRRIVSEVKSELTANFGATDFTYSLPSGFLPYDADLRDRGLQRIDPMMVSHLPFGVTGPPQYWYYYNGRIGIYPVPDAAYTINVYHAKVTEDLTDIPCFMRPLLVWHVVARLRGSEGWEDDEALFKRMYDNSLNFAKDQFFIPEVDSIMDHVNG